MSKSFMWKAYWQGVDAGIEGKPLDCNPYAYTDYPLYTAWRAGWIGAPYPWSQIRMK